MPVIAQIGGLIVGVVILIVFSIVSYPRRQGRVREYNIDIPETLAGTSEAEQGMLAKLYLEGESERVGNVKAFLSRKPQLSYVAPGMKRNSLYPRVLYLGRIEEGKIIHALASFSWLRPYQTKSLSLEGSTLRVRCVPDWFAYFWYLVMSVVMGAIGGCATAVISTLLLR